MKLVLKNVEKAFISRQSQVTALKNINLKVKDGDFVCLVGPSGCGKSTVLNIIAGLEPATKGEVILNGRPVLKPGPDRVLMFQESALYPWLTVVKNIEFGLELKGMPKKQRRDMAMYFLNMVKLTDYAQCYIHQLSGGMKQRVALARALALNSEVLLMDEPFAALDNETRKRLHQELLRIWEETRKTIIFVTHSVEEAVELGNRILVFSGNPGTILYEIPVPYGRPRKVEEYPCQSIVAAIKEQLKDQASTSPKEDLDLEWVPSENYILCSSHNYMGRGI